MTTKQDEDGKEAETSPMGQGNVGAATARGEIEGDAPDEITDTASGVPSRQDDSTTGREGRSSLQVPREQQYRPTIQSEFGIGRGSTTRTGYGDFGSDLAPGGVRDFPGGFDGGGGNLMGPNHPRFTGGGGGMGMPPGVQPPGVGGLGMRPRFDPYGPPGGPTDLHNPYYDTVHNTRQRPPRQFPGEPNPDHQRPPNDFSNRGPDPFGGGGGPGGSMFM